MTTVTMALIKSAKSKGGDRYECDHQGERITIYVPQSISRTGGTSLKLITVTFQPYSGGDAKGN